MRGMESGGEAEPPEMIDWSQARIVKGKLISTAKQMAGCTCRPWSPSTVTRDPTPPPHSVSL